MPLAAVCVNSPAAMPRRAGGVAPLRCRSGARAHKAPLADLLSILDALDIRIISTTEYRLENCTMAHNTLRALLAEHGAEHVVLVLRTITESEGNARALIDPVIRAVSALAQAFPNWTATGLRWIEAFDSIPLLARFDAVKQLKRSAAAPGWSYLAGMLTVELRAKFADLEKPHPTRAELAERRAAQQSADVERKRAARARSNGDKVAAGLELIRLRPCVEVEAFAQMQRMVDYPRELMIVAQRYGARPEVYSGCSWAALQELCSLSLSESDRAKFEAAIAAGHRVTAREIKAARVGSRR